MTPTIAHMLLFSGLAAAAATIAPAQGINERQAELYARIDAGVSDRSLTAAEATRLRSEFQAIATLETQYRSGGLTEAERADLNRRFDQLTFRVRANRRDDDRAAGINARQAELDAQIDAGVRNRSLTAAEANRLRSDYQALARLERQYRADGLTEAERADLNRRFDQLSSRIRANRRDDDRAPGIDARQAELNAQIDAGVRNRSLTVAEADRLRSDYLALARLERQYRADGLTDAERADLNRRFDQLSSRIRANRRDDDRAPGINARQAELYARIDAGVRDRSLTAAEASRLRYEYQALARLETQYRAGGLTEAERADLNRRFDQLSRRIRYNRLDDDDRWTNLSQRQAQFNQRLNRAVSERRVTPWLAMTLRNEFNTIAMLERQYRQSAPGITVGERNDLNARFNQLEIRYRQSTSNSSYWDGYRQHPSLFDFLFGIQDLN